MRQIDSQVLRVGIKEPLVQAPDLQPPPVASRLERRRGVTWNKLAQFSGGLHELVRDFVIGFELPIDLAIETLTQQLIRSSGEQDKHDGERARIPQGQPDSQARMLQEPEVHGSPS